MTVIHSKALKMTKKRHFERLVELSKHHKVKSIVIDHDIEWAYNARYQNHRDWKFSEFQMLVENVPISKLSIV